ncbi:ComF family protein [Synechococcus sp. PCC 7336]|uniref:ComF family protein n=1 Tax=Synechococcus sp. PCC 7336 TaxID=195250 RepID=UPI00034C98EC|nr:ComF family protein [Synechococcus sp. PCC 7336]
MTWLDWLFAPTCPLCQRPTASGAGCFCRDCAAQLHPIRQSDWVRTALNGSPAPLPVFGWGLYRGPIQRMLRSLKYDCHPEVGDTLGQWLGLRWQHNSPFQHSPSERPYTVVPIPLHRERRQERGFNQAEVVSRAFCEVTGDRHRPRLLRRVRATTPQYGLSAAERSGNLVGAFVATEAASGDRSPILLVDDIFTTGSTLAVARQVLQQRGWRVAAAVVVACAALDT